MKFTHKQNKVLSEIYRRLNKFHKGNLDANLLLLAFPYEAKKIKRFNLIEPVSNETARVLNWYKLTEKGKIFFSNYTEEIDDVTFHELFWGNHVKRFNADLLPE